MVVPSHHLLIYKTAVCSNEDEWVGFAVVRALEEENNGCCDNALFFEVGLLAPHYKLCNATQESMILMYVVTYHFSSQ